jgi:hypothetical protein
MFEKIFSTPHENLFLKLNKEGQTKVMVIKVGTEKVSFDFK